MTITRLGARNAIPGACAGRLDIPDGPWMADPWLMPRPQREATSGHDTCIVDGCEHPAGTPDGEEHKQEHRLCLGHRRRRRKDRQGTASVEDFAKEQAERSPILKPRGARTAKDHYPPIDFRLVHPRYADELRWVTATKVLRGKWRNDYYVNRLLRLLIEYGTRYDLHHVADLLPIIEEIDANGTPVHHRMLRLAVPSMAASLRFAATDMWSSLYWHPQDHQHGSPHASSSKAIQWERVSCPWLRHGLMRLCSEHLRAGSRAWGTIDNYARAGALLSRYIEDTGDVEPSEVTRPYFLDFLAWVRDQETTRPDLQAVNVLARLLFDLRDGGHVPELPDTVYLLRGENPTTKTRKPKPFPADILTAIDDLIEEPDALPDDIQLLLRIFRAVSPRPSEALALPLDCLTLGSRGYTLEYFQSKVSTWRRVPLPKALGEDLAKHVAFVRERFPGCGFLFPYTGPSPRINTLGTTRNAIAPWPYSKFKDTVWAAYQRHGIGTSSLTGEVLTGAQLHRFRHSIATGLLKEGWSQYEVQKFLGHSSPTMMQAYAEIHEDTLRTKYEEFVKHSVDVTGTHQSVDTGAIGDVERLRDRMVRSALPNGFCTLPENQTCDFVPSPCLTCKPFFRTTPTFLPIHIRQRDESLRELELAKESGRERAIDAHTRTVEALTAIIDGLEAEEAS